jgi:hypothetical protein
MEKKNNQSDSPEDRQARYRDLLKPYVAETEKYALGHYYAAMFYKKFRRIFEVLTYITGGANLGSIIGDVASDTSSNAFAWVIKAFSLFIVLVSAVNAVFKPGEKYKNHLKAYKQYYMLMTDMYEAIKGHMLNRDRMKDLVQRLKKIKDEDADGIDTHWLNSAGEDLKNDTQNVISKRRVSSNDIAAMDSALPEGFRREQVPSTSVSVPIHTLTALDILAKDDDEDEPSVDNMNGHMQ